jgi:predicted metal-dependent enzyme (double-stranded beta helix superfamily)
MEAGAAILVLAASDQGGGAMFDVDELIAECIRAVHEREPRLAVRDVLERAVHRPGELAEALPATQAELVPLHASPEVSVLKVVWAPGMRFRAHNHLMWAAIGLYQGQEDNTFYRRAGDGIVVAGGRELRTGDVALLGDDAIHAVTNPLPALTAAIHVYGGDITRRPGRREWDEDSGAEVDYDFERSRRYFASFQPSAPAADGRP